MNISIALATFNGAKYIREQLESYAQQTLLPDELIISDDASTDQTLDIVKDFSTTAPFEVKIYQNERNLGYAQNFNNVLQHTSGDLIFLSDQDDVWFLQKIERIANLAAHSKNNVIMSDASITDSFLNEMGLKNLERQRYSKLGYIYVVTGSCLAVRRHFLNKILPIPTEHWAHDAWIVHMAQAMDSIYINKETLQYRRLHESNASKIHVNKDRTIERLFYLVKRAIALWNGDGEVCKTHPTVLEWKSKIFIEKLKQVYETCEKSEHKKKFHNTITNLQIHLTILQENIALRNRKRLNRIPYIILFALKGKYRHLYGFRSVLQDILVP